MQKLRISHFFPRPAFPLAVTHERAQIPLALHQHEFGELVIIAGGTGTHVTRRSSYAVGAGDVFFIPAGLPHGYRDTRNLDLFNVLLVPGAMPPRSFPVEQVPGYHALFHFEPRFRRRHQFESHLRLSGAALEEAVGTTRKIQREIAQGVAGFELMATGLLLELLASLCRHFARVRTPANDELLKIDRVIGEIVHHAAPPRLRDLARQTGMSVSTFQRAFRRATETSPRRYVVLHRLRKAAAQLREPGVTITEVAYAAGFNDSNYFSRLFRRHFGTTPRAWRTGKVGQVSDLPK